MCGAAVAGMGFCWRRDGDLGYQAKSHMGGMEGLGVEWGIEVGDWGSVWRRWPERINHVDRERGRERERERGREEEGESQGGHWPIWASFYCPFVINP